MCRAKAVEPFLRDRGFGAGRCDVEHALPGLLSPVEILLGERANNADIEKCFRLLRIDGQRLVELRERPIGLIGIVVRNPQIGAGVHVPGIDFHRRLVPPRRVGVSLGIAGQVAKLHPHLGVGELRS